MASPAGGRLDLPRLLPPRDPARPTLLDRRPAGAWAALLVAGAALAVFCGMLAVARTWSGPFTPAATLSQRPSALPAYAAQSLLRMVAAYLLSLAFALVYGHVAAYHRRAERLMIPLLDIMQSIPVLSFLPGVMLAMVALFPHSQLGVELGAVLLIFTSQVWNLAFSFYSSLRTIPTELREVTRIYGFNGWQRLVHLELPFAALGLVWNSMVSFASGWFSLMVCEMFVLGRRDFRLRGLGSFLQTAAGADDLVAIGWGLLALIAVIVLCDLLVWRPLAVWAERFKFEPLAGTAPPRSAVLDLLRAADASWPASAGSPRRR